MKTKDTTIKFTSKSGKEVIVTVHRKYGAYVEHHHDSEEGIDYDTNEFANDQSITVEVLGVCKERLPLHTSELQRHQRPDSTSAATGR